MATPAERVRINIDRHCAPPMTVSEFRTSCFVKIGEEHLGWKKGDKTEEDIADEMGVSTEVVKELSECCDPKHLECPDEGPFVDGDCLPQALPEDSSFALHRFLNKDSKSSRYLKIPRYVKYFDMVTKEDDLKKAGQDEGDKQDEDVVDETEVLLSVAFYHNKRRRKDQEYLVVSRQNLTALRDVIVCQTDHAPTKDCSEDPNNQKIEVKRLKDVYKSAYFFIEGVFYNDMRDPANVDYSKVVINWAKSGDRWKNPRLGVFRSRKMEETTFEDIKFRMGAPYLYCHQGDCEHLMFITDMRIISDFDPKRLIEYPILTSREGHQRKICSVCNILTAKWITRYDELAFEDPSFFCDSCFDYLHYDKDGKKVCDFEAYPFERKMV